VLAVTAGLRIVELLGLRWEDLDLGAETLRVRHTRSRAKSGPPFTTPKNGKGRSIRLTQRAVEALRSHKAAQAAERLKFGGLWEDNDLVFCTMAGKPLGFRNAATASFKPLLKKAGLPDMRFHDPHHTCATLLLSRGHHPKLVQELLGARLGGDDARSLLARTARNGRPDRSRDGGGLVLKGRLRSALLALIHRTAYKGRSQKFA